MSQNDVEQLKRDLSSLAREVSSLQSDVNIIKYIGGGILIAAIVGVFT